MLMMLSASLVLLAASPNQLGLAMFSALIFGGAYMSLTGLYLMTGIRLLPGRLSMGPVLPFMACALGQAVGSPVIGTLVDQLGYANAFFALLRGGACSLRFCRLSIPATSITLPRIPPALLDSEEDTGLQAAYDQQLLDEKWRALRGERDHRAR
ncbi:major facilitator transporter, partial [Halomonas sp. SUBG004]